MSIRTRTEVQREQTGEQILLSPVPPPRGVKCVMCCVAVFAVCCSVVQCVAVCCIVLQCFAWGHTP